MSGKSRKVNFQCWTREPQRPNSHRVFFSRPPPPPADCVTKHHPPTSRPGFASPTFMQYFLETLSYARRIHHNETDIYKNMHAQGDSADDLRWSTVPSTKRLAIIRSNLNIKFSLHLQGGRRVERTGNKGVCEAVSDSPALLASCLQFPIRCNR